MAPMMEKDLRGEGDAVPQKEGMNARSICGVMLSGVDIFACQLSESDCTGEIK